MVTTEISKNYAKLRTLLEQLFRMDQADLDFGIYRIMNQKRDEINQFLDNDLLPQVKEAFGQYQAADKAELTKELEKTISQAEALGADPETLPKVQQLREQLGKGVDTLALEDQVFSHLANFFARYYDNGDFMSLRRYKEGVYAIPYEGEEVKLHWANADQYYIKTAENFTNYTFKLPDGRRVHFELIAASTEQNNNKEIDGKDRRFVLNNAEPLEEKSGELFIRFEYRPREGRQSQDQLNTQAVDNVFASKGYEGWLRVLKTPAPTERNPNRTLFEKHLAEYTARNTFDYFIHKDLGGFLRRELDFYIKNEVMHLDDIEHESAPKVEQYLSLIKVLRNIAHKIIAFLEQLENFQKKLWLKKKFVIETQYCITLDRIPEELYPEIIANDAQREEWVHLFAIDEIEADLTAPAYSAPLTEEFLNANQNLVLDTRHFSEAFKQQLLASIDDLDEQCDGLLIHSENFQALRHIAHRYSGQLKCIYIDPPYNAKTSEILYKNTFKHSAWMSLLWDRIALSQVLLMDDAVFICAIDENEQERLGLMLQALFPTKQRTCVSVVHNPRGIQGAGFSYTHEFAYFVHRTGLHLGMRQLQDSKSKPLMKTGSESERETARNCFYPIYIKNDQVVRIGPVPPNDWSPDHAVNHVDNGEIEVWPISITDSKERKWRYARQSIDRVVDQLEVREGRDGRPVIYLGKDEESYRTVWSDAEFNAAEYGSTLLKNMVDAEFSFPKSIWTVHHALRVSNVGSNDITLDFFSGSGTTAHAIINMNREDGGNRRYVMVEMGTYFDSVLKPRITKAAYASDWRNGKPVSRDTGISHCIKYIRLESYEDTLNNLELRRTDTQATMLEAHPDLREEYMLSYMLDFETQDSQSLLNIEALAKPNSYTLKVERDGEMQTVNVDLVETFNWLLGLSVKRIDFIRGVRVVDGTNPQGERVLILWRDVDQIDNDALDEWFHRQQYSTRDLEYDIIYVNGDNNLENWRREDQTWKVRLIEEDFHRLMFDTNQF